MTPPGIRSGRKTNHLSPKGTGSRLGAYQQRVAEQNAVVVQKVIDRYGPKDGEEPSARFLEYMNRRMPTSGAKELLRALASLMDNRQIGGKLNTMVWAVTDMSASRTSLLTSDRPLIVGDRGLAAEDGFIAFPMGPYRAIFAFNSRQEAAKVAAMPTEDLVRRVNLETVQQAAIYVYGVDDEQLRFVQNRMGKRNYLTVQQLVRDSLMNYRYSGPPDDQVAPDY